MKNDKPALELFLDEVARLTGLPVCIYDLNYFTQDLPVLTVPHRLRIHCSPLCEKVKTNPAAWAKCVETEYARAEMAANEKGMILHTCHAGLTDLIIPLYLGQRQIGALYLGQAVTQSESTHQAALRRLAAQFGFSLGELQEISATQMPHLSKRELMSHHVLLNLVKQYIQQAEELAEREAENLDAATQTLRKTLPIEQVPTPVLDQLRPHSAAVRKAIHILRSGYWKKLDLAAVARAVGLSQSHFSRLFRAETGLTFRDCLLKTRISAARFLLKKTDYSVNEISQLLGYSSAPAFVRAFKIYTRCTPHEFLRHQAFSTYFEKSIKR